MYALCTLTNLMLLVNSTLFLFICKIDPRCHIEPVLLACLFCCFLVMRLMETIRLIGKRISFLFALLLGMWFGKDSA